MPELTRDSQAASEPQVRSSALLAAVRHALAAIVKHRDCIHGPDYDYENDECYQPEAELYRVIPELEKAANKD